MSRKYSHPDRNGTGDPHTHNEMKACPIGDDGPLIRSLQRRYRIVRRDTINGPRWFVDDREEDFVRRDSGHRTRADAQAGKDWIIFGD